MAGSKEATERARLKQKIKRTAEKLGANMVGFANVERWEEFDHVEPEFFLIVFC